MAIRPSFRGHPDGSVSVRLPSWLRGLLRDQFEEFAQLLQGEEHGPVGDPLEELTGLRGGSFVTPTDPVLRRLRPDAYAPDVDEGQAATDFRRFTERDLAALQNLRVAAVRETLGGADKFELSPEAAQEWLGALNDLRLALGTVLGVTEEAPPEARSPQEAQAQEIYGLLGYLQHLLLVALGAPSEY